MALGAIGKDEQLQQVSAWDDPNFKLAV